MFSSYFSDIEKKLLKKYKGSKSAPKKGVSTFDFPELAEALEEMISPNLSVTHSGVIDSSGYAPSQSEGVIYKPVFRKMAEIFNGKIPSDVVFGSIHACSILDRKNLIEKLVEVAHMKKCDRFSENSENIPFIPSFMISFESSYNMKELKDSVLEIYKDQNVDPEYEVDIVAVLGTGILVKNWREKRSFVALETGADTLKWLFILMNEYLDMEKKAEVDLRSLVTDQKVYKEY